MQMNECEEDVFKQIFILVADQLYGKNVDEIFSYQLRSCCIFILRDIKWEACDEEKF